MNKNANLILTENVCNSRCALASIKIVLMEICNLTFYRKLK